MKNKEKARNRLRNFSYKHDKNHLIFLSVKVYLKRDQYKKLLNKKI
ncbi:hypothetical protein FEM08_10290 [Flavobacterium gilvum]|nr:hypothetical protein FEM08_10290 [Flavobacterium gilvum]